MTRWTIYEVWDNRLEPLVTTNDYSLIERIYEKMKKKGRNVKLVEE